MAQERLNRYLSRAAGVSRRTADEMIRRGRVTLDGKPVREPGTLFDADRGAIRVDGNLLVAVPEEKLYVMAYKPDKVVTTMKDKEGRSTAAALVGELSSRVYPVGRLDYHTTGLLLFTNDGELAYRLTHPKFGVEKTYIAKVRGVPTPGKLGLLRKGIPIDGVPTNPAKVNVLEAREGKSWISIRIAEGRHHQVRKMFDAIGHRVMKLRRVAVGPLELKDLEPGEWRHLTGREVRELLSYVDRKEKETAPVSTRRDSRRKAPSSRSSSRRS
ncbi:MAG: pseudouridine synthase [Deltaproteobacteria bacterium]